MQRRLTLAMVGIALASVLLVGTGVLILAQLGAREEAEAQAIDRVEALTGEDSRAFPAGRSTLDRTRTAFALRELDYRLVDENGVTQTLSPSSGGREGPRIRIDPDSALQLDEEAFQAYLGGETVLIDDPNAGGSIVRAIRRVDTAVPLPAGATAGLVVGQSVVTIGNDARTWFAASAVAVLAGSVAAAWLLARRFARPIREIEEATSSIAAGDFGVRLDVEGSDELAELGHSVNRMAEDLERSKALDQQFLMSVSHDLRTPLTAIAGYAEALTDGAIEDATGTGEIIQAHAERLERLVGDLLDLAKLDANRFTMAMQPLDVGVAIGRTVAGLTPRAESLGLSLRFQNSGPLLVSADPDRLAQAVGNVIENAIKFAESEIVASVSPNGTNALIEIIDDGPGIAAEDLTHVFERLYISSSQPERAENPSGMGLAIVRELTTAMGGSVSAEAADHGGTKMTIRLPLLPPPAADGG